MPARNASTHSAPLPGAELLHVLMLTDLERADRIGEFWGYPQPQARPSGCTSSLRHCEDDRILRAVLVGMLREVDRQPRP